MAAASFPWFINPWEGVSASDALVDASTATVAVAPVLELPDFDYEDPLAMAAALAVDVLITAASTAAAAAAVAAAVADDNAAYQILPLYVATSGIWIFPS